jgi:hypothetical protein
LAHMLTQEWRRFMRSLSCHRVRRDSGSVLTPLPEMLVPLPKLPVR